MHNFGLYFTTGLAHILTWKALDHILFVTALCLRYQFKDYKKIFLLVTAFTIGHCTTLILSAFNVVGVKSSITEFFIALTILLTAISNVFVKDVPRQQKISFIYIMALLFGMVHGLGFAYGLKSMLGKNENIFVPLLAFNCGIEAAQILVALAVLLVSYIFVTILRVPFRYWLLFISGIIFGLSLQMAVERNPFGEKNSGEVTWVRRIKRQTGNTFLKLFESI
ncbi:HupE/UreJ family protein [Parafilimonas sp.]|uniref:HupE/UreJ family protein n=1 Tax=Parafilimonas sp. TaxID=1969739 RepID=UPI0039E3B6D4